MALALEIVWFRMLAQYLAATTYAFTIMLATVLAGIAIGGAIATSLLRIPRDWPPSSRGCSLPRASPSWHQQSFSGRCMRPVGTPQATGRPAPLRLAVSLLMGLAFPIALHIAASSAVSLTAFDLARRVGRLYSLNVLGAIGALIGGFVLIPLLERVSPLSCWLPHTLQAPSF